MTELVSAFKCILENKVEPLAESDRQEACTILVEESFSEFLDYLEDKGSIDKDIKDFLSLDMYLYEVGEKGQYLGYFEEDFDKRTELVEKVFDGQVDKYAENYEG